MNILCYCLLFLGSVLLVWYAFFYRGLWYTIAAYAVSFSVFYYFFPQTHIGIILMQIIGGIILSGLGVLGWDYLWCFYIRPWFKPKPKPTLEPSDVVEISREDE